MSWLNGELILNGMSKKDLAYAHDYIRSTVRNNGDTEEFPNLGENLLPIVQRKIICKSYEDAKELADSLNWEREYNLLIVRIINLNTLDVLNVVQKSIKNIFIIVGAPYVEKI